MFAGTRNFLYRHRRKFLIGGGIVGGLVLLSRYAEYKIFQWHDRQTHALIEKQKRRQHYEKTRQTANATALNLSSSVTKIVSDELEIDGLLHTLRNKPANKLKLWGELKVQGFSRCIATIYTSALVGSIVHAKLMLLGGYTYGDTIKVGKSEVKVTPANQEKYLSHLQNFIEKGLPLMMNKIRQATDRCVQSLGLEQQISLEQLEGILKDVTLLLNGESSSYLHSSDARRFELQPWSRYVTKSNISKAKTEDIAFYKMTEEMLDIIDGDDFNLVVQNLIQHGLNHVLDYVADFYPQPSVETVMDTSKLKLQKETKCSSDQEENPHPEGNAISVNEANNSQVQLKEPLQCDVHSALIKTTMPVAKLIPILSDLVHPSLSPAPGHLLQFVLLNEQLENLGFNIYEAFSVPR